MSEIKETKLTTDEIRLAQMFKALGNPVRLEIMQQLADCQRCICGDIVAALPLAQSTVSQHLKVLKEAGLIRGEIEGPATCYCLDLDGLNWFKEKVNEVFQVNSFCLR
jgi:ArsR family transcriptional regulator, arsenate/arsenite/antimonite-responsive transcriptional repressor